MTNIETITLFIFFMAIASIYFSELYIFMKYIINCIRNRKFVPVKKYHITLHVIALSGVLVLPYGYFVEPYNVEVTFNQIYTDKLKDQTIR
ncbi:MAG TPA: hypothetical protein VF941_18070, partial [Clostridia bacterium]